MRPFLRRASGLASRSGSAGGLLPMIGGATGPNSPSRPASPPRLCFTVAYVAPLLLVMHNPRTAYLRAALAPAGRIALTDYLAQCVVGLLIFTGLRAVAALAPLRSGRTAPPLDHQPRHLASEEREAQPQILITPTSRPKPTAMLPAPFMARTSTGSGETTSVKGTWSCGVRPSDPGNTCQASTNFATLPAESFDSSNASTTIAGYRLRSATLFTSVEELCLRARLPADRERDVAGAAARDQDDTGLREGRTQEVDYPPQLPLPTRNTQAGSPRPRSRGRRRSPSTRSASSRAARRRRRAAAAPSRRASRE